ncbi:MAG: PAS domain S-box protein [Syntrophobacteraceae bacterium]|nr:PAS domain S-box protein [Syntrophobacteraceae bacterium]
MRYCMIPEEVGEIGICQGDIDYRGIVKHINEGVVVIKEGKIVYANNAFVEMSERNPERILDADFSDFILPADRDAVTRYCSERLVTESLSGRTEFVMLRESGEAIIEMKVSVVECGGTPTILGALTDITERRRTRHDLQRVKERLESILHSMNDVVVSLSPSDHSIIAINPAAEALYGVPLREFTSGEVHIMHFVHPHDRDSVDHFYMNLPEAEFDEAEYRIISRNRMVKWVRDEGHIVYSDKRTIRRIDHVIRDITEEKKAIDALKQSEAKYRDFFESTNDMAYAVTPEGTFMDINDAGMKLLGLQNREEALAANLKDFYVDVSQRAGLLAEIYEKGHVVGKQVKLKNRMDDVIEVAVTARAKTDDSGDLIYYDGLAHNITKALEDQRNRVLRNAAGAMCHHLNTQLMQLDASRGVMGEEMKSLEGLIERLAQGADPGDIAVGMKQIMENMRYFQEGITEAYERISDVTTAFNRAFLYKEESYATDTILDIFKTYGYEGEDAKQ